MKELLRRLDPFIWLLFGQGLLIGTILLTPWLLVVGLLVPLGVVPAEAVEYRRMVELFGNPIGRFVLLGLVVLPLWKGAHHLRHLSLDHGGHDRDAAVGTLLYGVASLGTLIGIVAVARF